MIALVFIVGMMFGVGIGFTAVALLNAGKEEE